MKTSTLFRAYDICSNNCQSARVLRYKKDGIAIDKDQWAVYWQRNNRLADKLYIRILARLEAKDD